MMPGKPFIALLILLSVPFFSYSQGRLSSNAQISVITCEPGNEMYSAFGHSAIRISDPNSKTDLIFNYGTFDFDTPNFYLKFARGKLDYMLSISPYKHYIKSYKRDKRGVREQVLNLDGKQKQKIYDYLMHNAKPENKYYRYDFFFDNCATRVADVIANAADNNLRFGSPELGSKNTFRLMLLHYLKNKHWTRFGINLIIGLPADKTVSNRQASFLPVFLETLLRNSEIKQNGEYRPLVKAENKLYSPETPLPDESFPLSPQFIFWMLWAVLIFLSSAEYFRRRHYALVDRTLFFITGIAGLLIAVMWLFTEHDAVVNNLNIIWALPLHLIAVFFIRKEKTPRFIKIYFGINALVLILFLIWFIFKTHCFDIAVLPVVLILLLRSAVIYTK